MTPPHVPPASASSDPWHGEAANDRAPREKRSPALRFADAMGTAMLTLASLAFVTGCLAMLAGAVHAALLLAGGGVSAGLTLILVTVFERKLLS